MSRSGVDRRVAHQPWRRRGCRARCSRTLLDDLFGRLVDHELGAVEQVDEHVVMVLDALDVVGVHEERVGLSESGEADHRFPRGRRDLGGRLPGDCAGEPRSRTRQVTACARRFGPAFPSQTLVLPPCAWNAFRTVFGMDTAEDLSHQLWTLRELLEELVYKLEVQRLLLGAGKTRWLPSIDAELAAVIAAITEVDTVPPARPGDARRPLRPRPHRIARRSDRGARRAARRHPVGRIACISRRCSTRWSTHRSATRTSLARASLEPAISSLRSAVA